MPRWTLEDTCPAHGRTFRRPLDPLELCFIWDGFFDGTEDSLHHYELHLSNGVLDAHLFSETNLIRAWVSTKKRYPLAGATVRGADGACLQPQVITDSETDNGTGFASEPHFVVQERDLATLRPQEVVFGSVASAEAAHHQAIAIIHGPRLLSEDLLVRLHVIHERDAERKDVVVHLMLLMAHCVTDGTANRTIVRCLLDTLARGAGAEPVQKPLEERLAMAIPSMELESATLRALAPGVRRWRKAVGTVIHQLRMAKIQGGHTLPCRLTRRTPYTSARPGHVSISLSPTETAAVIAHCRLHGITYGSAFLVLAQVAMTRVLYRRYLRGEISEEEWAYRQRQPHINGSPFNLRPYLDKTWFDNGGGSEFILCISLIMYQLPFMTLGARAEQDPGSWSDGAPPFSDLFSFDRFLHRARLVKTQAAAFFRHPLFLEIVQASHRAYLHYTQARARDWLERAETASEDMVDKVLSVTEIPSIWAHGGSSLGNLDMIFPTEYPPPATHPLSPKSSVPHSVKASYVTSPSTIPSNAEEVDGKPRITVKNAQEYLHVPPAELYLGAATLRGQMRMYVHYDVNVFEDEVVHEWLDEVKGAVLWYLGRTQCETTP